MTVFADYASYYDLLYQAKDYEGEVSYLDSLIRHSRPDARSLLDLGCGTGRHDRILAERGYDVTGIDRSEAMVEIARARSREFGPRSPATFELGDIRSVRLQRKFDAVVSLFHVFSYLTTNADLRAAFATVGAHLRPGGLFIFDCWYGPAVLTDRPVTRVKRIEDEQMEVTRLAEPTVDPVANTVEVDYHLFARSRSTGEMREARETHLMRYFFGPEIELLLETAGLRLMRAEEWGTGRPLGWSSWAACIVAEKATE